MAAREMARDYVVWNTPEGGAAAGRMRKGSEESFPDRMAKDLEPSWPDGYHTSLQPSFCQAGHAMLG